MPDGSDQMQELLGNAVKSILANTFTGEIKPKSIQYGSPPLIDKRIHLANEGDYSTQIRMFAYEATPERPRGGVYFQMHNGKSKCFCRFKIEDFELLFATLSEWIPIARELYPKIELSEDQCRNATNFYQNLRKAGELAFNSNHSDDDSPGTYDDVVVVEK